MNRKAQIAGQVVIMIMAVIVFTMVLLYGYKSIKGIDTTRKQVEIIEFSESLKSAVKKISLDFGSVKRVDLSVPAAYQEVCFVDIAHVDLGQLEKKSVLIADSVRTNLKSPEAQNVFTIPISETPIRVEKIAVNSSKECAGKNGNNLNGDHYGNGFICIPTPTGKLSLRLEGMGDRTCVREWK